MTTTKRPGRSSEHPPVIAARSGAPLPLVTQPIMPIEDGGQTRVDNPLARVDPALTMPAVPSRQGERAVVFGHAHMPDGPKTNVYATPKPIPAGPPPEIGLTQHALPADEHYDPRLSLVIDPDSDRAAAFRVLRHHLLELGRPQVIIVSSALQGEGKTTTALNLALALAECGRSKVLLAETHVRRPQLANVFRLVPPWCFAEQLAAHRHQPMLPWSLVEIPQLWLHVAAINPRIEKTQLLDAPAFTIAMERLRLGGYEHIVIDAPPVLGSADVNLMADSADAVVFALRARQTNTRDVRRAIDQIGANKVVGTVIVE
jgi:Mrp family chromosome partitioning ATPase